MIDVFGVTLWAPGLVLSAVALVVAYFLSKAEK
jgi:hypothetical protein